MKKISAVKGFLLLVLFLPAAFSCRTPVQEKKENERSGIKESFIEANQYMRQRNSEQIRAFVDRVGWDMHETPTGLWYQVLEKGNGPAIQEGNFITYAYETRLLDGTICYSADTIHPRNIVVGKGNIESGLQEGLLLLHENDRARFIIPPYLAYGNFGDRDKIPGSSILIIEVKIMDVKR